MKTYIGSILIENKTISQFRRMHIVSVRAKNESDAKYRIAQLLQNTRLVSLDCNEYITAVHVVWIKELGR